MSYKVALTFCPYIPLLYMISFSPGFALAFISKAVFGCADWMVVLLLASCIIHYVGLVLFSCISNKIIRLLIYSLSVIPLLMAPKWPGIATIIGMSLLPPLP